MVDENPITVEHVEAIAREKLPAYVLDYYAGGADDQTAMKRNQTDFDR